MPVDFAVDGLPSTARGVLVGVAAQTPVGFAVAAACGHVATVAVNPLGGDERVGVGVDGRGARLVVEVVGAVEGGLGGSSSALRAV